MVERTERPAGRTEGGRIQTGRIKEGRTRREALRTGGALATATLLSQAIAVGAHAGEDHTIKIALVGCGGRGTGAAVNALSTTGPTTLWAMADVFEDRMANSYRHLSNKFQKQMDVPTSRRFLGFDAYRRAIESLGPGGVVLLATPPAFRPLHVEYAVERGCHVFMEKSFAVDAPGIRRIMQAGESAAKQGLKIAGGLMSRHYPALQAAVQQIHDGAIGDVICCWVYRKHGPVGFKPRRKGESELAHQIRNYSCFTWLNGSFFLDWLIHNIDVGCWVKDSWPVSAQGDGGRQVRDQPDQMFDHYSVEFSFDDGTRMLAQGRHMAGCWGFFGDVIHGTTGCAVLGEGVRQPRIYRGHQPVPEKLVWEYSGPQANPYQVEHDVLFDAIRHDRPHNESQRCAQAAMAGILGRIAAESGQLVTSKEALASASELAPRLDQLDWKSTPPVVPDSDGHYPIPVPGRTEENT